MGWSQRVFPYYNGGASVTSITPGTGSVSVEGQDAHVRPIDPPAGSVVVTGQTPVVRVEHRITPGTGEVDVVGQPAGAASQSQIISAEYVGDGASTRSFTSDGFLPLWVIVVGKDGSGNVVAALKSPFMPAGKSQPFLGNQDAAAATRDDRILSVDANGFTVGPDLNASGRNYAYIMFPAGRFGAVTAGTYVGAATTSPGSGVLGVSANAINGQGPGSTQFVTAANCERRWYRPAGSTVYTPGTPLILAGRRMIRNSDGAVLAECAVGGFVNTSSCAGVGYILGNEGAWHWEEQYIELHTLVPDMLLLMADDDTGVFLPGTFCPPPNVPTTNRSWDGSGGGSLFAYFASDTEAVLHLFDTGGTVYNAEGVRYHWLALKGDELGSGGVRMKAFKYTGTGDGPYPLVLDGCGFSPEWAYIEANGDQFHWSKRAGSGILGTNVSRRWIDGTGDQVLVNPTYTITFQSDGVEIPATNTAYNVLGREYTVLLIGVSNPVAATDITPDAGEVVVDGQTPVVRTEFRITPGTGHCDVTGYPPSAGDPRPTAGAVDVVGYAPTVRVEERVTPGAGSVVVAGQQPVLDLGVIPGTGEVVVTGYPPAGGNVEITPGTGTVVVTGYPPVVRGGVTPPTPAPPVPEGGVAMAKMPFWPKSSVVTCEAVLVGRPGSVRIDAEAEEDFAMEDEEHHLRLP